MDGFQRLPVGPFGQAVHDPGVVVEPVGDVPDAVLVLDGDIKDVGGGDIGGGGSRRMMTIEEEGHGPHASDSGSFVLSEMGPTLRHP